MEIKTIQDAKKLFWQYSKKIIWIESSAFLIYFPGKFLSDFEIIAYKDSLDNDILKKTFKITSLNTLVPWKVSRISILEDINIQKYLKKQNVSYIITRKETKRTEENINKLKLKLLWNKSKVRAPYENKKTFREILTTIWVNPILWENVDIEIFLKKEYSYWKKKYGKKIVIQIPEITKGWWSWTIFITNKKELDIFKRNIKNKIFKNKIIETINITKYIQWISTSIIWCATKYGTLTNCVQTQVIDIPEVINTKKWSWLFCGHDRSFKHYNKEIQKKADDIAKKIWTHMYSNGYKWIFWLDLIIDEKEKNVYIVECNSRYTGAFPMLSMIDEKQWNIPMDIFHLLEHLNINYTIDFNKIDLSYKNKKEWSHIILSNKDEESLICKREVKSWIYTIKGENLTYKREWNEYKDIKKTNEFIITDGNPKKWQIIKGYKESCRICHLLFPWKILKKDLTIKNSTKKIIDIIYTYLF